MHVDRAAGLSEGLLHEADSRGRMIQEVILRGLGISARTVRLCLREGRRGACGRQAEQDAPKPMKGFAGSLRQNLVAVTAGLTLPWSSGGVEGHVNRVKTPKRAMYGRASFELLRARILTQLEG